MIKIKIKELSLKEMVFVITSIILSVCAVLITKDVDLIASVIGWAELEFINENDYVQN